jgi:integrase
MPMITRKAEISLAIVDALKPGSLVWDTEVSGFAVRCQTKAKVYCLKYRVGGRQRWYTIGRHGSPWTPKTARNEAKKLLGLVADDKDPARLKEANKEALTVSQAATKFLTEHVDVKRKARTAEGYRDILSRIVIPALGNVRLKDVQRADISRLHHSLRITPYQANRVLAVLSKMFNMAESWGERPDNSNPCRHIEKFKEAKRERFLSADELAALSDALGTYNGSPYVVAAIKLLVFTGARLQEILTMRWEWIDFERKEARLPDSKTGAKTLHFPQPVMAVLADLPRIEKNPYVIVGRKEGASLVNLEKPWRAIRQAATIRLWRNHEKASGLIEELTERLRREPTFLACQNAAKAAEVELPAGMNDVRIHDLRHAFASVAASAGLGLPIIGKLLGVSQPQTTARYAHLAADPVKAAQASVADAIAAAMNGKPAAEVVHFATAKRK